MINGHHAHHLRTHCTPTIKEGTISQWYDGHHGDHLCTHCTPTIKEGIASQWYGKWSP